MGIFNLISSSLSKSKLIKTASKLAKNNDIKGAAHVIHQHITTFTTFTPVVNHFKPNQSDIENLILDMMAAGAGVTAHGHYVPVSALLFPDTLAYLLRTKTGQVQSAEAYFNVVDYFENKEITFKPEQKFH